MPTMLDVVTDAFRKINLIAEDETPSAADGARGTTLLNDMLHGWKLQGVDLGHVTLTQAQSLPYDDAYMEGIKANLAVRFGAEYHAPVPQWLFLQAKNAFDHFRMHKHEFADDLKVQRALQPQNFSAMRYRRGGYNVNTDEG